MDIPTMAKVMIEKSPDVFCLSAAIDPSKEPSAMASAMEKMPIVAETGKPSAMISETRLSRSLSDGPRSPCIRSPM